MLHRTQYPHYRSGTPVLQDGVVFTYTGYATPIKLPGHVGVDAPTAVVMCYKLGSKPSFCLYGRRWRLCERICLKLISWLALCGDNVVMFRVLYEVIFDIYVFRLLGWVASLCAGYGALVSISRVAVGVGLPFSSASRLPRHFTSCPVLLARCIKRPECW